jgi:cardiolipin synthase A/B
LSIFAPEKVYNIAMATIRLIITAWLTAALLAIGGGCGRLPDVLTIAKETPAEESVAILSAKGLLSPRQSREILQRLKTVTDDNDLLARHNAILQTVSGLPLTQGNKVTLLVDGRTTYAAIFRAIGNARATINLETFKIENDEVGRRLLELLVKRQSEGVQVNVLYDSIGSLPTPAGFFDPLRKAGGNVVEVNPRNPLKAPARSLSPHADHRKMLIIDGRILFTGGINISEVYASSTPGSSHRGKPAVPWRDTDVEIEGPAVNEFQQIFFQMWLSQKGPKLPLAGYFPEPERDGIALVRAVESRPGQKNRTTYISYLAALLFSRRSIHLTNAYFIPDDRTLDALTGAARRGVDVKIVLPSITDSSLARYAMRYNYAELLRAGVKLYERRRALLHAKTAVVDGVWSTVGSTNFDFFSLASNYEVNAVILDREFARQMETLFARDLAESERVLPEKWEKRGGVEKSREILAHMLSHFM